MKTAYLIGGVALLGGAAYLYFKKQSEQVPVIAGPGQSLGTVSAAVLTQPSQMYPVQAPSVTRQDNASQPWASAKSQSLNQALPSSQLVSQAQDIKALASITSSVSSIWDDLNLGDLWSDGGSNNITEDSSSFDWSIFK